MKGWLAMRNTVLVLCLIFTPVFITGCSFLAGTEKAMEAFEETNKNFTAARERLEILTKKLNDIQAQYETAVKEKDTDKAAALLRAGSAALAEWNDAKATYDASKNAVEAAIKRVQDSKSAEDYIGNVIGIGIGAITGIFGGSSFVGRSLKTLQNAVKKTTTNVNDFMPDDKWEAFTNAQKEAMSAKERALFDKAAGLA